MVAQKLQPKTCSAKKLINIGVVYDYFDTHICRANQGSQTNHRKRQSYM